MITYVFLSREVLSSQDMSDMTRLLEQLVSHPVSFDEPRVEEILTQARVLLAKNKEGKIVGMASLYRMPLFGRVVGRIEEVVVDQAARGQGIGKELMRLLIEEAPRMGITRVFLTSNPARVEANRLYQSLGFEQYDTNTYKLNV